MDPEISSEPIEIDSDSDYDYDEQMEIDKNHNIGKNIQCSTSATAAEIPASTAGQTDEIDSPHPYTPYMKVKILCKSLG